MAPPSADAAPATSAALLAFALLAPVAYAALQEALLEPRVSVTAASLVGMLVMWLLASAVVVGVRRVERRPLSSIGWAPLSWRWTLAALALGLALSLLVPVLSLLVSWLAGSGGPGPVATVGERFPWWVVLLGVVTAAVTEEVLFRGYALERLLERTGSRAVAGLVSLAAFVAVHAGSWDWTHVVGIVLPLGAALTALYLWRRSLPFVILVHLVIDLPLVVLAL